MTPEESLEASPDLPEQALTPESEPEVAEEAPSSSPAPRRRWLVVAVVVAVATVVLLAGLYALGVGPFVRPGGAVNPASGDATTGLTYSGAVAAATNSTHAWPGPWRTLMAAGAAPYLPVLTNNTLPSSLFSSVGDGSCRGHALSANASLVTFPGFDGNLSLGEAPSWIVVEMNSTGTMLFDVVVSGSTIPVELYTGPACATLELIGELPRGVVDSSVAAATAMAAGGDAFVREHPGGWTTYSAADFSGNGEWVVEYSTCPAVGTPNPGQTFYSFTANVSLVNASLNGTPEAGVAKCSGLGFTVPASGISGHALSPWQVRGWGPPIGRFMALKNNLTESHSANYAYTVTVATSTGRLTWGDLVFTVDDSSGQLPSGPYFVEMYGSGGCVVAEGALNDPLYLGPLFGGGCSGTQGGSAPVVTGETVSILSTSSLVGQGDTFEIDGGGAFSGKLTLAIP